MEESGTGQSVHSGMQGVITELGELGPGAIITESGLARMMNRHPKSIKRAVSRGELPKPCRLMGQPVWTADSIIRHIEKRLEDAAKDALKQAKRFSQLSP
jgi:hypothetical protein